MALYTSEMYKNKIRNELRKNTSDYTHLIIVNNHMDYIKIKVKKGENIKDVLYNIIQDFDNNIFEIYNYSLDIEQQINEQRAYNIESKTNYYDTALKYAQLHHLNQKRKDGTEILIIQ